MPNSIIFRELLIDLTKVHSLGITRTKAVATKKGKLFQKNSKQLT